MTQINWIIFDVCSCNSNETLRLMNDLSEKGEFAIKEENLNLEEVEIDPKEIIKEDPL